MTSTPPPPRGPRLLQSLAFRALLALAAGLAVGVLLRGFDGPQVQAGARWIEALGGLWLNAFRMTVVPLIFALLVTGIAQAADAAATGRLAGRAMLWFTGLLLAAAGYSILATNGLLATFPVSPESSALLRASAPPAAGAQAAAAAPDFTTFLTALAPSNVLQAAAADAILPLVVFAGAFGFALTRLDPALRRPVLTALQAVAEAMIVIVRWVLWAAPVGVFALSLGVGLRAGAGAAEVLFRYALIVSAVTAGVTLLAYLLLLALRGPNTVARFARALAPVQALAVSTQSSLACLPAMVERSRDQLGVAEPTTRLVLPLAVAVFRFTSPVANLAVALFVAHVYGLQPTLAQYAAVVLVAYVVSIGSVSLPGQVSFLAAVGPICLTLGLPLELLPLLLAIEVIPDIFRTVGNVTGDMLVTLLVDTRRAAEQAPAEPPVPA